MCFTRTSGTGRRPSLSIFGFLPIGLAYQAGYSILAAAMMAVLVRTVWPKHLENVEPEVKDPKGDRS